MKKAIYSTILVTIFGLHIFSVVPVQAADPTITAYVAPELTITGDGFDKVGSGVGTITVTSNVPFDISFSGTSKSDTGADQNYPLFYKQDVDASGGAVGSKYDQLATYFGVEITDSNDVPANSSSNVTLEDGKPDTWGNGSVPTGDPQYLIKGLDVEGSPDYVIGTIDCTPSGSAKVKLYTKGETIQENQSGKYSFTVTYTVTAHP